MSHRGHREHRGRQETGRATGGIKPPMIHPALSLTFVFLGALCVLGGSLFAQPAYKLDVKAHLKPTAALTLDGPRVVRGELTDDPGFRLQLHFKTGGKTHALVEARSRTAVPVPDGPPGEYTVVLELFHPAYKGGTATKGEFKPVSPVLTYRLDAPEKKSGGPPRVTEVKPKPPEPPPAKKS
jgi:hypothetical protein